MLKEVVDERLKRRMESRFDEVYEYSKNNNVSMRISAIDISVNRVVEGIKARGFMP